MRLVLEDDEGEEVAAVANDVESFALLQRDLRTLIADNPEYPDAWSVSNLVMLHGLMRLLRNTSEELGWSTQPLSGEVEE